MKKTLIAFDTETHAFGPGNMAPKIVCLSYATDEKEAGLIAEKEKIFEWLDAFLGFAASGSALLVGHYVAYDMAVILANFSELRNKVWDAYAADGIACTGIREKLLDIAEGTFRNYYDESGFKRKNNYTLKNIAEKRLHLKMKKGDGTWRTNYAELDGVPLDNWPTEALNYAALDATTTFRIFIEQEKQKQRMLYNLPTQYEDARADFALRLMTVWGIQTDRERVLSLWNETATEMGRLGAELKTAGLIRFKKQSKDLFEDARVSLPEITKTMSAIKKAVEENYPGKAPLTDKGNIKTDKETLEECDLEILEKLISFNGFQKAASTYIEKMFDPIIHARFNSIGAASNRTSCSGPNLQNQPRLPGIRECFIPRPGRVFLACDFDSQEMRTLAQSCMDLLGKSKLADRYQQNRNFDPHLNFAARLAGISVTEAERRLKAKDPEIKTLRQHSKIANFGYSGGMGSATFVKYAKQWGIKLSRDESAALRDKWFLQWPEMNEYFNVINNIVGEASYGTVVIPQSGFKRGGCGYTDAANTFFQTLAAHISKSALFETCRRAYNARNSYLYGARPVLFIHDEIILEVLPEAGHEAAMELEQVLIESMEKWTPAVPADASATLMERWSKQAERVFENGRLMPWKEGV